MRWMLMPLRRYAEFSGRSRRKEYWMLFLGLILFYIIAAILMVGAIGGAALSGESGAGAALPALLGGGIIGILLLVAALALFIPSLAVGVRRLHDIDKSGWWLMLGYGPQLLSTILAVSGEFMVSGILNLVGVVGFVVILVMAVLPGTKGENRFGPDPKGPDHGEVFA